MWAFTVPWYAGMWPETQAMGEKAYEAHPTRRQRAQAVCLKGN